MNAKTENKHSKNKSDNSTAETVRKGQQHSNKSKPKSKDKKGTNKKGKSSKKATNKNIKAKEKPGKNHKTGKLIFNYFLFRDIKIYRIYSRTNQSELFFSKM